MRIHCEVGGVHAVSGVDSVSMYDTGSSCSFVSTKFLNFLFKHCSGVFWGPKQMTKYEGPLPISASNGTIDVLGYYRMPVKVGRVTRHIDFLVSDTVTDPLLLGRDAIDQFGKWTYDPAKKMFFLKGAQIPLVDKCGVQETLNVKIGEDVVIPPRQIHMVKLDVAQKQRCQSKLLMIEPHANFSVRTGLVGLSSMVNKHGSCVTQVMNLSREPVKQDLKQFCDTFLK